MASDKDLSYITFDDFADFAKDSSISKYEKIGFPDNYREGNEEAIFEDIKSKLPRLEEEEKVVLDLGCGCSDLVNFIIDHCQLKKHKLILADNKEMLSLIENQDFMHKIPGKFPVNYKDYKSYEAKVDVIIVYSVIHHVILEDSLISFLDSALELLNEGGMILLADIPNISKRNRFFASRAGIACHQEFTQSDEVPEVRPFEIKHHKIDDAVVMSILQRYRNFGHETYLLPQKADLPLATRREDVLIVKR